MADPDVVARIEEDQRDQRAERRDDERDEGRLEPDRRIVFQTTSDGPVVTIDAPDAFFVRRMLQLKALPLRYHVTSQRPLAEVALEVTNHAGVLLPRRRVWVTEARPEETKSAPVDLRALAESTLRDLREDEEDRDAPLEETDVVDMMKQLEVMLRDIESKKESEAPPPPPPVRSLSGWYTWDGRRELAPRPPAPAKPWGLVTADDGPFTVVVSATDDGGEVGQATLEVATSTTLPVSTSLDGDAPAAYDALHVVWCIPSSSVKLPESLGQRAAWVAERVTAAWQDRQRAEATDRTLTVVLLGECFFEDPRRRVPENATSFAAAELEPLVTALEAMTSGRDHLLLIAGTVLWCDPSPAMFLRQPQTPSGITVGAPDADPRLFWITAHNTTPVVYRGRTWFTHKLGEGGTITNYHRQVLSGLEHFPWSARPAEVVVGGRRFLVEICLDGGTYGQDHPDTTTSDVYVSVSWNGGLIGNPVRYCLRRHGLAIGVDHGDTKENQLQRFDGTTRVCCVWPRPGTTVGPKFEGEGAPDVDALELGTLYATDRVPLP